MTHAPSASQLPLFDSRTETHAFVRPLFNITKVHRLLAMLKGVHHVRQLDEHRLRVEFITPADREQLLVSPVCELVLLGYRIHELDHECLLEVDDL